jgi:hypothetical protein
VPKQLPGMLVLGRFTDFLCFYMVEQYFWDSLFKIMTLRVGTTGLRLLIRSIYAPIILYY